MRHQRDKTMASTELRWIRAAQVMQSPSSSAIADADRLSDWLGRDVNKQILMAVKAARGAATRERDLIGPVTKLELSDENFGEAAVVADRTVKYLSHSNGEPLSFEHEYLPKLIDRAYPEGAIFVSEEIDGDIAMRLWKANSSNVIVKESPESLDPLPFVEMSAVSAEEGNYGL